MKKRLLSIAILTASVLALNTSCSDDFVEREFHQNVEQGPFTSIDEMQSFVRGAYASMRATTYYGSDFIAYGEIRSDEMYSNKAGGYYANVQDYTMTSADQYATGTWNQIYAMIAKTNIIINTDVSLIKGQDVAGTAEFLKGQAYGLRALGFFDILRLYGQKYTGAPDQLGAVLPTVYDPKTKMARATISETEAQIEKDFENALKLMDEYADYSTVEGKTDLSIQGLKALASRYYLYKGDYAKVRTLTSQIKGSVISANDLPTSFLFMMNGAAENSIFEIAVGLTGSLGTTHYSNKIRPGGYANIAVKAEAYNSYGASDVRKKLVSLKSSEYFISGKYSNTTGADNIKMIRFEEVLLNGVEAELNGGSASKALEYYNKIITQRGLTAVTSVDMTMLKAERSKELLGEGLRQWDLLRWGDYSFVPTNKNRQLLAFPIPRAETNLTGNLIKSNPGYDN